MYEHLGAFERNPESQGSSNGSSEDDEVARKRVYIRSLRERIGKVCRGHAIWLREAKKVEMCFGANYWVTGEAISNGHSTSATSTESLTDTPFQLIKLADYARLFELGKKDVLFGELKSLAKHWIQQLETANAREFYAFPRPKTGPTTLQKFRLDDHVWIWRALRVVKDIGLGNEPENLKRQRKMSGRSLERTTQESKLNSRYSPAVFQKHALRRFTTENPVSKQRMLAVARSPFENRFYLHSRDTALLYKENSTFFSKCDALWEATMDVQKFHEESEDSSWGNPLRYTLAIMLGETIGRIDGKQPDDLCKTAKDILLQSSSANGLFPGALHPVTKEPELYQDKRWRDSYWHRTFEVPYVLWQSRDYKLSRSVSSNVPAQVQRDLPARSLASDSYSTQMEMKRRMPFNNIIVQQSIVELSDEWLYKFPSLFHTEWADKYCVVDKGAAVTSKGVIIDIPKTDRNKKKEDPTRNIELLCNERMYAKLREERTAQNSKKRLIWITNPNADTKGICCATSAKHETDSLDLFFKRHKDKVKYFSDEVTATANLWTTELHLSSYRLSNQTKDREGTGMMFLGGKHLFIERAGAGFRFVGDFFDRYWTCHVLETELNDKVTCTGNLKNILELEKLKLAVEQHKQPWKQRKVLELLLLDRMLGEITQRYQKMIEKTGQQLEQLFPHATNNEGIAERNIVSISNELFSKQMNNNAYLSFRKTWPAFQYSLQVMEEDLKEILEKIDIWTNRKADRKPEEPRWTKNDERRYRAAITKLTNENSHAIRDLRDHLATIQSLRISLSSGLQSTRDELNFLNAERIRYFTYLTAVFLPLGFATGIWSMAESSPRSESLKGMAVTAVVTLLLAIVAPVLVNVQKFNGQLSQYTSCRFWTKRNEEQNKASLDSTNLPTPNDREGPHRQDVRGSSSGASERGNALFTNQAQSSVSPEGVRRPDSFCGIGGIRLEGLRRKTREAKTSDDPQLERGKTR